jgi:hypothetical protein
MLRETDIPDLNLELLFFVSDVLHRDVHDRQSRRLRVLHAEHSQGPLLIFVLKKTKTFIFMIDIHLDI